MFVNQRLAKTLTLSLVLNLYIYIVSLFSSSETEYHGVGGGAKRKFLMD